MKIKIMKALNAYKAIDEISGEKMPFKTAHTLMVAKREIEPHVQFFAEKERSLVEEFAEKGENGEPKINGNSFSIANEKIYEYSAKHKELEDLEIDIDLKETELSPIENISVSMLESLSEIFTFKEE